MLPDVHPPSKKKRGRLDPPLSFTQVYRIRAAVAGTLPSRWGREDGEQVGAEGKLKQEGSISRE